MMDSYDESLQDNPFFKRICNVFPTLYEDAPHHNWLICVPRAGTVAVEKCTDNDFQGHILQPLNPLQPDSSSYCTLNGKIVTLKGNTIVLSDTEEVVESSEINSIQILFEEVFYYTAEEKFKVLCTEGPLQGEICRSVIKALHTVSDCVGFLQQEIRDVNLLNQVEWSVQNSCPHWVNYNDLTSLKNEFNAFYSQILSNIFRNPVVNRKSSQDQSYKDNICLALETYMIHVWDKKLMQSVVNICASRDSELNRLIRKFGDVEIEDLEVKTQLIEAIPKCKQELSKLVNHSTPLTKRLCLKRAFNRIALNSEATRSMVSTDDILPFFIYLVLKTSIANWHAQVLFMKEFCLSLDSANVILENDFYLATLEAAVEHISSGGLSTLTESKWSNYEKEIDVGLVSEPTLDVVPAVADWENAKSLFKLVKRGVVYDLEEFYNQLSGGQSSVSSVESKELCHPLCYCDKCTSKTKSLILFSKLVSGFRDHQGRSALHVAVAFGRDDVAEFLLHHHSSCVNALDSSGLTPLHLACQSGLQKSLLLLLHVGADLSARDNDGNTALHSASNSGHKNCVQTLLYCDEHLGGRIDINAVNSQGETALHLAAKLGFVEVVELLLEFGADVSMCNKSKQSVLDICHSDYVRKVIVGGNRTKPKVFTRAPVSAAPMSPIKKSGGSSGSPSEHVVVERVHQLLAAAAADDTKLVCHYLGLPLEVLNDLHLDVEDDESLIKDEGEEVSVDEDSGESLCHPLCQCDKCQHIHESKASVLVTSSSWVNSSNSDGTNPLHVSCAHGHHRMVRLLLACGGHVNARDRKGVTPLHLATLNDRFKVVKLLLRSEALVNMADAAGNSPLHYTATSGLPKMAAVLIEHGAKVNQRNYQGRTPLHLAKHQQVVSILVNNHADLRLTDRQGFTPLHLAQDSGADDAVIQLLQPPS